MARRVIAEYSAKEIEGIRAAGALLKVVVAEVEKRIRPGVTTAELDLYAHDRIVELGAKAAFPEVRDYPATLCTSVNEEIVHGIPSERVLREGDILSLDCGLSYQGFYADKAITVAVGAVSEKAQRLIQATREALEAAIGQMREGATLGDVSAAIQRTASRYGMSVVRDYTGHGIGRRLHEEPQVMNYGTPGNGPKLRRGMVFAIEPMLNVGTWQTETLRDNWTVVTRDRELSGHFEDTVAITRDGPAILTR